jgi:PIN domain nuclease of toxin-antitoxin system
VKLLVDTNALLWWFQNDSTLSGKARRVISSTENQVLVSTVVGLEISIKSNAGKLTVGSLLDDFEKRLFEEGMTALPVSMNHGVRAGRLPLHHQDPFDRMLIAQAHAENMPVVSSDSIFERYGVRRIW